jgi:hypothetical protein
MITDSSECASTRGSTVLVYPRMLGWSDKAMNECTHLDHKEGVVSCSEM